MIRRSLFRFLVSIASALTIIVAVGGIRAIAQEYTYDDLGRLVEVNKGTGSGREYRKYTLDAVGNRTLVKSGLGNVAPVANNDQVFHYGSPTYVWIFPLDDDTDSDNDELYIQSFMQPLYGMVSELVPGVPILVYDCPSYWWQCTNLTWDYFTYIVSDGYGGSDAAVVSLSFY